MPLASLWIALLAYLLGSIPVGYLLVRIFRKQDIRTVGSGNIGATNVLRSGGKGLGAATFLLDALKGSTAVLLGAYLARTITPGSSPHDMEAVAALSAVLGHMFPVWLGFKGGRGVSTGFGVFLVAAPYAALASLALFAIIVPITRYVSLASILASAAFPIFAWLTVSGPRSTFFFAVQTAVAALIVAKHQPNIRRLLAGTDPRFGRARTA
jgi:glycerol-3-phosphate acyltransferase PlsY